MNESEPDTRPKPTRAPLEYRDPAYDRASTGELAGAFIVALLLTPIVLILGVIGVATIQYFGVFFLLVAAGLGYIVVLQIAETPRRSAAIAGALTGLAVALLLLGACFAAMR